MAAKLTVAITGASGLIGRHLVGRLQAAGHEAIPLRRGGAGMGEGSWDVGSGEIRTGGRFEVMVHLAGRSIATRWTAKARREIWDSRVPATEQLCRRLAARPAELRPKLLMTASATGIYGDRGDEVLTEASATAREKTSFLADICRAWERAAKPAEEAGIRVIYLRTGVVLSARGGVLAKLRRPAKLGLAGPLGSGRQFMPWISLTDLGELMLQLIASSGISGAINAVSPHPVRQHEFARTLAGALHRPAIFPMPGFMVKLVFGRMGEEVLLGSQRAISTRMPPGFHFAHETLEQAMRAESGDP